MPMSILRTSNEQVAMQPSCTEAHNKLKLQIAMKSIVSGTEYALLQVCMSMALPISC